MKGQCFPVTRNIKDPLVRKASSQGSTPEGTQIQHLQPLTREQSYQLTNPGPRLQEATTSALPSVIRSNWFFWVATPKQGNEKSSRKGLCIPPAPPGEAWKAPSLLQATLCPVLSVHPKMAYQWCPLILKPHRPFSYRLLILGSAPLSKNLSFASTMGSHFLLLWSHM